MQMIRDYSRVGLWSAAGLIGLGAASLWSTAMFADDPPLPTVVDPGSVAGAPADAIVLFDGSDTSAFTHINSDAVKWGISDGALVGKPGSGSIISTQKFGPIQLHLEFATPAPPQREGQGRGNSGVYLQGRYEVQILDSFENTTYANGQCGAIYGQHPPLVNVCRSPGEWQSFDIIFHPPDFDEQGKKTRNGTMTVLHNGVLIQDHAEIHGSTTASLLKEGPGSGPLYLQDHGNAVRFRNIWLREL